MFSEENKSRYRENISKILLWSQSCSNSTDKYKAKLKDQ